MSDSTSGSLILLAAIALLAFLLGAALGAIRNRILRLVAVSLCLIAAGISVFAVDVNVPLSASHFRPSGEPTAVWVALAAWLFRLLPVLAPVALMCWQKLSCRIKSE